MGLLNIPTGIDEPFTPLYAAVVDPMDLTTVKLELNNIDFDDNQAGFKVLDMAFGDVETSFEDIEDVYPGALPASEHDPMATMTWRLAVKGSTPMDLRARVRSLATELMKSKNALKLNFTGDPNNYYVEIFRSKVPQLFRAGENSYLWVGRRTVDVNLQLEIRRYPYIRLDTLKGADQLLSNGLLLEANSIPPRPDNWAWQGVGNILDELIDWPTQTYQALIAAGQTSKLIQGGTFTAKQIPMVQDQMYTFSVLCASKTDAVIDITLEFEYFNGAVSLGTEVQANNQRLTCSPTEALQYFTCAAAPANTTNVAVKIAVANTSGNNQTVMLRQALLLNDSDPRTFRVGAQTLKNDYAGPWGTHFWVHNPGNVDALAVTSVVGDTNSQLVAFMLGRLDQNNNLWEFSQRRSHFTIKAKGVQYDADTANVTDGLATAAPAANNVARTSFAGTPSMAKRWRLNIDQLDGSTLAGRFAVWMSLRLTAGNGTDSRYRVMLKWGTANQNPLARSVPEVPLDATNIATSHYFPIFLGYISLPNEKQSPAGGFYIDGCAARDAGAGNLFWDQLWLVPADEQNSIVSIPGFLTPGDAPDRWRGDQLTTPAPISGIAGNVQDSGSIVLSQQNMSAANPPTIGQVLPAGRHVWRLQGYLQKNDKAGAKIGEFRLVRHPGGGGAETQVSKIDLINIKGQQYTNFSQKPATLSYTVTAGDVAAGDSFYAYAIKTVATGSSEKIALGYIIRDYQSTIISGQTLIMDDVLRLCYQITGNTIIRTLPLSGPFLTIPSGPCLIKAWLVDVADAGYDAVDARGPLGKYDWTRTATITTDIVPYVNPT